MNIYNFILCILTNLFRLFIIWRFMKVFYYSEEKNQKIKIMMYIGVYLITTSLYLLFHMPLINMISYIAGIFLIVGCYSGNLKKRLFVTLLVYSINMVCDYVIVMLFVNYEVGEEFNQSYAVLVVLLTLLCEIVVEKFFVKKRKIEFITPLGGGLIIIPLCSIMLLHFLFVNIEKNYKVIAIASIGLLIINMAVFYLYYFIVDAYANHLEKAYLEQEIKAYAHQLNNMMRTEGKIRSLQHDLKHHITGLKILAQQGDKNKILNYLASMQEESENVNEIVYSGNKEIDAILNYMILEDGKELNDVKIKVAVPEEALENIFNLNIILGNLIDNAIEAAKKSEQKMLDIKITFSKGILFIQLRNSFNTEIKKTGNRFVTTKIEKGLHGIGLQNVQKIVNDNKGSMKINYDNNIFEVVVMLYVVDAN